MEKLKVKTKEKDIRMARKKILRIQILLAFNA